MKKLKKPTKILIALFAILGVSLGAFLVVGGLKTPTEKISVIATNFPAYDFARAVIGDKADLKMLIKPGAETHDFEPTPQDIINIKKSKMFIYTGGESDEWVKKILKDVDQTKTKVIKMMDQVKTVKEELVEGMEEELDHDHEHKHNHDHDHDHEHKHDHEHEHEHDEEEYDEHVWTSPKNAIKIIGAIKNELSKIDTKNANLFAKNAKNYTDKLAELDKKFQTVVEKANRKTLVFGDRFPLRYFVDEYKLNYYAAFPGCSEQTEASSQTIAFLIDKVKTEKIPVIFKIELSDGKIADAINKETGAKVLEFNSAHNLSAEDFKKGVTYLDLMYKNLEALKEALN